jgi:hypothetical protein
MLWFDGEKRKFQSNISLSMNRGDKLAGCAVQANSICSRVSNRALERRVGGRLFELVAEGGAGRASRRNCKLVTQLLAE